MFGNRVLLRWKEPRFAYKNEKKQTSWTQWLILFSKHIGKYALIGLVIGIFVQVFSYSKNPYSVSTNLLFVGMLSVLGIVTFCAALLNNSSPVEVSMREKNIVAIHNDNVINVSYEAIQSCSFVKNKVGEREYDILEIKDIDGNTAFVEIDPDIKIEDITKILEVKNVRIKPSLIKLI